jgi:hypothetical protein
MNFPKNTTNLAQNHYNINANPCHAPLSEQAYVGEIYAR